MEQLQYGDIIKFPCPILQSFLGISFTSSFGEEEVVDCVVEKYWENDNDFIDLNTYKLKITPINKMFAGRAWYTSDINDLIVKNNPKYKRLTY